jgi:hypothetical protein
VLKDRIEFKYGDNKETRIIGKAYVNLDDIKYRNYFIRLMSPN